MAGNATGGTGLLCGSDTSPTQNTNTPEAVACKCRTQMKIVIIWHKGKLVTSYFVRLSVWLKRKCCYFDEMFIIGCTGSCHFENAQCNQSRKWWISASVFDRQAMLLVVCLGADRFLPIFVIFSLAPFGLVYWKMCMFIFILVNKYFQTYMASDWLAKNRQPIRSHIRKSGSH